MDRGMNGQRNESQRDGTYFKEMKRLVGDGESDVFVLVGDLKNFLAPKLSGNAMIVTEVNVEKRDAQILMEEQGGDGGGVRWEKIQNGMIANIALWRKTFTLAAFII